MVIKDIQNIILSFLETKYSRQFDFVIKDINFLNYIGVLNTPDFIKKGLVENYERDGIVSNMYNGLSHRRNINWYEFLYEIKVTAHFLN